MVLSKMNPLILNLALAGLVVVSAIQTGRPQTPKKETPEHIGPSAKDFVGTWNWMFKDRRFATMILEQKGDQLTGTVTNEWLKMDEQGRITGAETRPGSAVVSRISMKNGALSMVETTDSDEFEWAMTLISPTTAELRIVDAGAPPNAEPIRLEKVWSEPPVDK